MSTGPLTYPPVTRELRQEAVLRLALLRLGKDGQADRIVARLQEVQRELAARRMGYVASASATSAGGILADMEAMDAIRE